MDFGRYTQHLLAAAFILAAIAATGIFRYMEGPPRGVHQWRQTDCASIALNYFQDSPGFFHPQEHNLTGENGATVSEFPVLYYLDAQLYRLFGAHELIMRLVNLLFLVAGLGYLYRLGMLLHGSFLLAMIPVLLLISSPVWVYYGVHFLPNVPAISCCIAGWFYFFQWRETPSKKWLITWLVLFLSGALLKTSDGMSL
ncbi:MAG: glycosyltransferase family 39 protein, partial [Chitinophagales bacterium]|nr:glycosyltransferase family 39 protein [Chitinophagales bacterium]